MLTRLRQIFRTPKVECAPRTFHMPAGLRVYAVGDIHGRASLLSNMLALIAQDAAQHPDAQIVEIFLGDYIDRGMHSREVIDLLRAAPPARHQRICLMGNHEAALLDFLQNPMTLREWGNFGGYACLASYGFGIPQSMAPQALATLRDQFRERMGAEHIAFIKTLKHSYVLGDYLFVHAGILPGVALADQSRETMLRVRDVFLNYPGYFEHYVVHGHTPVEAPQLLHNRANLDVSNAHTPSLACLVMHDDMRLTLLCDAQG